MEDQHRDYFCFYETLPAHAQSDNNLMIQYKLKTLAGYQSFQNDDDDDDETVETLK